MGTAASRSPGTRKLKYFTFKLIFLDSVSVSCTMITRKLIYTTPTSSLGRPSVRITRSAIARLRVLLYQAFFRIAHTAWLMTMEIISNMFWIIKYFLVNLFGNSVFSQNEPVLPFLVSFPISKLPSIIPEEVVICCRVHRSVPTQHQSWSKQQKKRF